MGQSAGIALVLDCILVGTAELSANAIWTAIPVALQPRSGKRAISKMTISRDMILRLLITAANIDHTG